MTVEMERTSTAQIIRDLAVEATTSEQLEPGTITAWVSPATGHVQLVDLTKDEYLDTPKRKKGVVRVRDVPSFAIYYAKHHLNGQSEVFADDDRRTITGVLNAYGSDITDWQDHRVALELRLTTQWQAWTSIHGRMLPQAEFADFLDARITDIAPGEVSAARLLELSQVFTATTTVQFSSGSRLRDGSTQLTYLESHDSNTKGGKVDLPNSFNLGIRPYEDTEPMQVRARLRYRIQSRALYLGVNLDDPDGIARDAFTAVAAKLGEATSSDVIMGTAP